MHVTGPSAGCSCPRWVCPPSQCLLWCGAPAGRGRAAPPRLAHSAAQRWHQVAGGGSICYPCHPYRLRPGPHAVQARGGQSRPVPKLLGHSRWRISRRYFDIATVKKTLLDVSVHALHLARGAYSRAAPKCSREAAYEECRGVWLARGLSLHFRGVNAPTSGKVSVYGLQRAPRERHSQVVGLQQEHSVEYSPAS